MNKKIILLTTILVILSGCSSVKEHRAEMDTVGSDARTVIRNKSHFEKEVVSSPFIGNKFVVRQSDEKKSRAWLNSKIISLSGSEFNIAAVVASLREKGINITSSLPLESYLYSGFGVTDMDAETAMKVIFGASGLDYEINDKTRTVEILPMRSKTWYLNIGRRVAAFSSNGQGATTTAAADTTGKTGVTQVNSASVTSVSVTDDFWASLKDEITARMAVLVPRAGQAASSVRVATGLPPAPGAPTAGVNPLTGSAPAPGAPAQSPDLFISQKVGAFSLNPETGAISIQAPSWMLDKIGKYLDGVQEMYNTEITFSGELVLVTTTDQKSEGVNLQAFSQFAKGRYAAVATNNSMGGVNITFPSGNIPMVNAGNPNLISSAMMGITSPLDGLQIFNNYMSGFGDIKIIQKPVLTTTSGIPGEFSKRVTHYYNQVTQTAAAGNNGAAVSTQNNLIPVHLGTLLKINPRYDLKTGLVRAQISLNQQVQSGVQQQQQYITSGAATSQIVTPIPIVTALNYSGETLLRDGDIIVMGGMTEDGSDSSGSGLTGLHDSLIGGIFGSSVNNRQNSTYYFVLRVNIARRG